MHGLILIRMLLVSISIVVSLDVEVEQGAYIRDIKDNCKTVTFGNILKYLLITVSVYFEV